MDQDLQTKIAAALLIDTPHEEIAANLGVPVERVQAEIDQTRATIRNAKAEAQPVKRHSRRWLKFTLRGLILLTLGVALFFGGRVSRQREMDRIRTERDEAANSLKDAHMQADVARMRAEEAMVRAEKALIEATRARVRVMKGD